MVDSVEKVTELVRNGTLYPAYDGLIERRDHEGFVLLDYSRECQYENKWDEVTLACRGLILDSRDWSVAARPFPKFFNLGEVPSASMENLPKLPFMVFEKVDGSLGTMYRNRSGTPTIATRGSFVGEQAIRGTEMLQSLPGIEKIPDELTPLFEIVYRANKTVIKYDFDGLVLLAINNRHTGEELRWDEIQRWADRLGIRTPRVWSFASVEEARSTACSLPYNMEGFVLRFSNGLRLKLKSEAYLELHRLVWALSEKRVLEHLIEGTFDKTLKQLPEELRPEVESVARPYIEEANSLKSQANGLFAKAPKSSRKEFAEWTKRNASTPVMHAMFAMLNGYEPKWFELTKFAK